MQDEFAAYMKLEKNEDMFGESDGMLNPKQCV